MTPCPHSREGLSRVAPCTICGERKPVSASEVKLARTCWRKWAFRYASQYPKPEETQAQRDGTQLHALVARYLTDGTRPQATEWMGELALAGIDSGYLPEPGTVIVEASEPVVLDGIPFVVIRDWYSLVGDGADVGDHKTSSNPSRYAIKSHEERLDDPQHLLYGTLPAEWVSYRWLYYPTKGRGKVTPYDGTLTRREIRGGLERVVLPIAERAWRLRETEIDPNSLEPNTDSCMLFNRPCEYTDVCDVNRSALLLSGLAPGKVDDDMTMPANLFASLPPVNGAPAAAAASAALPAPVPFKFEFPSAPTTQTAPAPAAAVAVPAEVDSSVAQTSAPTPAALSAGSHTFIQKADAPEGYEVHLRFALREGGDYDPIREGSARGRGATLEDAIKNALAALPR